jgi:hypothetical protein
LPNHDAGRERRVRWLGGHVCTENQGYKIIDLSRIDGYSERFRRDQVDEIVAEAKTIGIDARRAAP